MDSAIAVAVGETLRAANFTATGIRQYVGPQIYAACLRSNTTPLAAVVGDRNPLDVLIRLFVLRLAVPEAQVAALLPVESMQEMIALQDGQARSLVDLKPWESPAGDLYLVSDIDSGEKPLPDDHVMGMSGSSDTVANLVVRAPVRRALDLGTGSGIQAVLLASHVDHLTMTDVNPRALRFARTTLDLNDIAVPAEFVLSDLYTALEDREFDLIVINPPYVIGPRGTRMYRDAGGDGDDISRRVIQEGARRLAPGGLLQTISQWVHLGGEPWEDRVMRWVEGLECDAWIVQIGAVDVVEYISTWMVNPSGTPPAETFMRWQEALAGVDAVGAGVVTLRRTDREPVIRVEHRPFATSASLETAAWLAGVDLLRARERDFGAATVRLRSSAYIRREVAEDEPSGVTLVNDVGPPARHRLRPATVRALARCDGRTTIREIVASTDGKDQNTVRDEIRDLIAAGTLVSGAAALGRPTTVLTRAICGLTVAVEIAEDSATEMARLLPGATARTEAAADWTWRLSPNAARTRPYAYPPDDPTYTADDLRPVAEDIHDWVAANAQERVLVRAAVAASGTDAIVLTGEDAQLRASIALALARRGAIIYSTRFAVLDRHGAVEPYLTGETNAAGYPSARPRVFAALSTGDAWDVAERGAGQTALSLVANAPRSRTRPAETLAAVRAALDGATPIDGSCGLPEDAASHLLDMLGAQRHHDSP